MCRLGGVPRCCWQFIVIVHPRTLIGWPCHYDRGGDHTDGGRLVSTAESVAGSDHVVVLAVPAAKSPDHVVPPEAKIINTPLIAAR